MSESNLSAERQAFITLRWRAYRGEARANWVRVSLVGVFYALHLWSYASSQGWISDWFPAVAELCTVTAELHKQVTFIALAWVALALAVRMALRSGFFPIWLGMLSTTLDTLLLVALLVSTSGPQSPLVPGFLLLVLLAGLRLELRLVWLTTAASMIGYLAVCAAAKWPELGSSLDASLRVPRYHQALIVAAILMTGVMVGQMIRLASWSLPDREAEP